VGETGKDTQCPIGTGVEEQAGLPRNQYQEEGTLKSTKKKFGEEVQRNGKSQIKELLGGQSVSSFYLRSQQGVTRDVIMRGKNEVVIEGSREKRGGGAGGKKGNLQGR